MIHTDERYIQPKREGLGEVYPDEQGASQPGAVGYGHSVQILPADASFFQRLVYHRDDHPLVVPGCELRHHPAIRCVYQLRGDHAGSQHALFQDRSRGIIA